jgi:hypothetical protein
VAREALELEEPLSGQRFRRQELRQLVDLSGSEGDVDERKLLEDLLLDGLGPAPADPDDPVGMRALEVLGLMQVGDEPLVGLLADGARVEEDQLGVLPRVHLRVSERLEHPLHALGVVLVHLAPERGDVVGPEQIHGGLRPEV